MELFEARKNFVSILSKMHDKFSTVIREHKVRHNARLLRFGKDWEEIEKQGKIQDAVRELKKIKFEFSEKEMDKLHMFFSPIRIPAWLELEQAKLCISLYDLMYPGETLMKDGSLLPLESLLHSKECKISEPFFGYLKKVLAAKDWAKKEVEKSELFWKRVEALPPKERKAFDAMMRNVLGIARDLGKKCDEENTGQ